jgi:hypothetical protein
LLISENNQSDDFYRVSISVYKKDGTDLIKRGTSEWQQWHALGNIAPQNQDDGANKTENKKSDNSLVQLLNTPLQRIIQIKHTDGDEDGDDPIRGSEEIPPTGGIGGLARGGVDLGTRCIVELQTRKSDKNGDKKTVINTMGWGILSLISSSLSSVTSTPLVTSLVYIYKYIKYI